MPPVPKITTHFALTQADPDLDGPGKIIELDSRLLTNSMIYNMSATENGDENISPFHHGRSVRMWGQLWFEKDQDLASYRTWHKVFQRWKLRFSMTLLQDLLRWIISYKLQSSCLHTDFRFPLLNTHSSDWAEATIWKHCGKDLVILAGLVFSCLAVMAQCFFVLRRSTRRKSTFFL